ncbi:pantothenate kinase [Leptolyngbya sp. AN02str]|uniref:pantothenate kinase n=1 Tax=Leptolyngbya sp. AN02str TaxID=3423363 RepID=UPI003D31A39C
MTQHQVAIAIGNSRLHWAVFRDNELYQQWDTAYLSDVAIAELLRSGFNFQSLTEMQPPTGLEGFAQPPQLWLASVVPARTQPWLAYPHTRCITLNDIPLGKLYPTLGIDRALALWGAVKTLGAPVLVVDAGTALTFTAADPDQNLLGGAIAPGLTLQLRSLGEGTAALPSAQLQFLNHMPNRWSTDTSTAILSGVLHLAAAAICDYGGAWQAQYPTGAIALTGGDGPILYEFLQHRQPAMASTITLDPHLLFRGIPHLWCARAM